MLHMKDQRFIIGILLLYACLFNSCQQPSLNVGEDDRAQSSPTAQMPQAKQHAQALTTSGSPEAGREMTSSSDASPENRQVTLASSGAVAKRPPAEQPDEEASLTATKRAKKEEEIPGHRAWFTSFAQAVARVEENPSNENEEAWEAWEDVLYEGRTHDFLTKSIVCPDDSNPATDWEYTPLHYVASRGRVFSMVKELVEDENVPVDIQTQSNQNTALHLAASRGNLNVVEFLIEKGANPNLLDHQGGTALHYAAAGDNGEVDRDIIHCLIENGADFKKTVHSGSSMLDTAVMMGNITVIEYWEDVYKKNPDPVVDAMTKEALALAKYTFKKHPEKRREQRDIIKILKKVMQARQAKEQASDAKK